MITVLATAGYLATVLMLGFGIHVQAKRATAAETRARRAHDDHLDACAAHQDALAIVKRERDYARLTVTALAEDLARERRAAVILRTGLLDAQDEVEALLREVRAS